MRLHSLTSRFLLTLLISTILPFLIFGWFALSGMRKLIDDKVVSVFLPQLSADHAERIDNRLQQIYQACSVVREIARQALSSQEKLQDFEDQVALVPDLFDHYLDLLMLADSKGEVVYWQDGMRLDETTWAARAVLIPDQVADTPWFQRAQEGGEFWLPWGRSPYMHRGLEYVSKDPADYHLGLVIDVPLREGPPGALYVLIRWREVQELLDETMLVLTEDAGFPSAEAFLVDPEGRIQAHTDREHYGEELRPPELRQRVLGPADSLAAAGERRIEFTNHDGTPRMAGFAAFGQVENRRWSLVLHMATEELFLTSRGFARVLVLAIAVAIVILVVWSLVASRAILRPVRRLAEATHIIAMGDLSVRVPARGSHELADLGRAFNTMAEDLAAGRERLKDAERQAAWAEMARQVAHEIKNPLTPMRMSAQLLAKARREEDPRAPELADRLARTVLDQTAALDRIASDFRHFAGSPSRSVADVRADELLAEIASGYESMVDGGELELSLEASAGDARVRVDRQEIGRAFLNLLHNALQAAANQHQVCLVHLSSSAEEDTVVFRVQDNGSGVPEELRQRLFEPYFTTKSSGTGLGLAISRRILEAHGGAIALESSGPSGTVFRLELPRMEGDGET